MFAVSARRALATVLAALTVGFLLRLFPVRIRGDVAGWARDGVVPVGRGGPYRKRMLAMVSP
jgi:hypothetical protein